MSSGGFGIPWDEAVHIAAEVSAHLEPWCQRSKCVGSVRRKRPNCGDIEFVIEPHFSEDLLGNKEPLTEPVRAALEKIGAWVKGGDRQMVITDALGTPHLRLEVFLVHPPAQWGSILAIRTGPPDLNAYMMKALRTRGYRHVDGCVKRGDEVLPTETEEQFFGLVAVPCVAPTKRDELAQWLKARSGT